MLKSIKTKLNSLWFWFMKILPSKRSHLAGGVVFAFLVVFGILFFIKPADAGMMTWVFDALMQFFTTGMLMLARIAIAFSVFFLRFFIEIAKYNNYIDAPTVKVGWIMVRDVANMFFVVGLLVIAFGTILGIEQYEWKKTLVKFILAAVLINFSNMICQLIIDVAHVFTITFLNAVSTTAGGNLISMFKSEEIYSMVGQDGFDKGGRLDIELFGAAIIACFFALLTCLTIGAYLVVMLARMVVLWALIILSPLAYIFQILPQTQSYAKTWWDKFAKQVMVAPVMVFFLWLSFATLGSGNVISQLETGRNADGQVQTLQSGLTQGADEAKIVAGAKAPKLKVSISEVSTWENMANFLIAMAFMIVGINVVQQMGVVGGGLIQKAQDFAGKVAAVAAGVRIGQKAVKGSVAKVGGGLKQGSKYLAKKFPIIGGEKIGQRFKILGNAIKGHYNQAASDMTDEGQELAKNIQKKRNKLNESTPEGIANMKERKKALEEQRDSVQAMDVGDDTAKKKEKENKLKELDESIKSQDKNIGEAQLMTGDKREKLKEEVEQMEKELPKHAAGGVLGYFSRKSLSLKKQLAKTEKQAEYREKVAWKRTGSESGGKAFGISIGMGGKGLGFGRTGKYRIFGDRFKQEVPVYEKDDEGNFKTDKKGRKIQARGKDGKKKWEPKYVGSDAQDRIERGWYKGEEMRSAAKDDEYETLGTKQVLAMARQKYNVFTGKLTFETEKGTMAERIAGRKLAGQEHHAAIEDLEAEAKFNVIRGNRKFGSKTVKDGVQGVFKAQAMAKVIKDALAATEGYMLNKRISDKTKAGTDLDVMGQSIEKGFYAFSAEDKERKKRINDANEKLIKRQTKTNAILAAIQKSQNIMAAISKKEVDGQTLTDDEKTRRTQEEDNVKTKRSELVEARREIEKIKKEVKAEEGVWAVEADRLRNGDMSVADKYYKISLEELKKEKAKEGGGDAAEINKWQKVSEKWAEAKENINMGGGVAWQYGVSKAQEAEVNKLYGFQHNSLLSEADQRTIWDKRGIDTPKSSLIELVEQMEKDFTQMSYDQFVNSTGSMFINMMEKHKNGTMTDAHRASMVGFFKRGFNESWIDDIIIGVMSNDESRTMVGDVLGWTDAGFTKDKIRDLEMFIATGANLDFAKNNVVTSEFIDEAVNAKDENLRMSVAGALEGLKTGKFKNINGGEINAEGIKNIKANIKKRLKKQRRILTTEQKELFNNLLEADDLTGELSEEYADMRKGFVQDYLNVTRENQSAMQFFGNLRNDALAKKHGENAGWTLNHDVGGGEMLYVASGVRMATSHVYSDANKTDPRLRAGFHPHMSLDLAVSDKYGQIATRVREDDDNTLRGDVTDMNSFRPTTNRTVQFYMGVSSADKLANQRRNGYFSVGKSKNTQALWEEQEAYELEGQMAKFNKASGGLKENGADVVDDTKRQKKIKRALAARHVVKNLIAPKMKGNMKDFMFMAAAAANTSAVDALKTGKISLNIPYIDDQGNFHDETYDDVEKLIGDINGGKFGNDIGSVPGFTPTDVDWEDVDRDEDE